MQILKRVVKDDSDPDDDRALDSWGERMRRWVQSDNDNDAKTKLWWW